MTNNYTHIIKAVQTLNNKLNKKSAWTSEDYATVIKEMFVLNVFSQSINNKIKDYINKQETTK